jgi:hypothetical protein
VSYAARAACVTFQAPQRLREHLGAHALDPPGRLRVPVRAGLRAAFAGADRLLFISASEVGRRIPQHAAVIAAARRADQRGHPGRPGRGGGVAPYAEILADSGRAASGGALEIQRTLENLLGRPVTPLATAIRAALDARDADNRQGGGAAAGDAS